MAFGYDDVTVRDMRRRADLNRQEVERQRTTPQTAPELRPLVGPGGMFWPTFEAPDAFGGRPEPERQAPPWEYGPPAPAIPPPVAAKSIGALGGPPLTFPNKDVLGWGGSTEPTGARVSTDGLPPPPQPSGLSVKFEGGDWQEADPEGHLPMPPQQRSGTAYDPVERRTEHITTPSGGGTFSMMTAPENVDLATRGSQLEDAQFAAQIRDLEDPMAQHRAGARIDTDERIRFAEAQDRISMGKQAQMAKEAETIQNDSDQNEYALATKYGIDPRDTEGSTITDEAKKMQYMQERENLKREVQARMTILLSRFGMAPKSAAGYEALSGF